MGANTLFAPSLRFDVKDFPDEIGEISPFGIVGHLLQMFNWRMQNLVHDGFRDLIDSRLLLGPTLHDRQAVTWALEAAGVEDLAQRFVDELSGGERQRVILARALAQQARVLLLDEPTANLDLHHQVAMLELVRGLCRERGLAVLTAVHDLQLAALFYDRVALLSAGQLVSQGSPEAVLTAPLLLEAFGQRVVLSAHPTHGVPLVALVPNSNARRLTASG